MNISEITYSQDTKGSQQVLQNALETVRNQIQFGIEDMNEEQKARQEAKIRAKLEAGKKLTAKEMRYLKKYNPTLYLHAVRIEMKRRSVEEQLKHAKSKQEVSQIQDVALATISKNDPVKKYMIAAVQETVKEFKETEYYKKLPATENEATKHKGKEVEFRTAEEEDKEYAIKYEVGINSYQIAFADSAATANTGFVATS